MDATLAASPSALWLGLATSVSPCPLAANIAAMSYIGREVGSRRRTLVGGLLYALGRALAYAALAAILVGGLLSVPQVALFLQAQMNRALGPLLVVVGLVLLEWVRVPGFGSQAFDRTGERLVKAGLLGALPLGAVLAPAFCPVSAGFFFCSSRCTRRPSRRSSRDRVPTASGRRRGVPRPGPDPRPPAGAAEALTGRSGGVSHDGRCAAPAVERTSRS